jgi:hypothetical protein
MKTIQMPGSDGQLVQSMNLNTKDRQQLQRNLGILQGLVSAIRGLPTPKGYLRTERAVLAELQALMDLGRNLAWGIQPTETGLAVFQFRMEAIVRAALQLLHLSDPE